MQSICEGIEYVVISYGPPDCDLTKLNTVLRDFNINKVEGLLIKDDDGTESPRFKYANTPFDYSKIWECIVQNEKEECDGDIDFNDYMCCYLIVNVTDYEFDLFGMIRCLNHKIHNISTDKSKKTMFIH